MTRKARRPDWPPLGSVSEGTRKASELVPAFADVLEDFYQRRKMPSAVRALLKAVDKALANEDGDDDDLDEFLDDLEQALSDVSAPYTYFGASEGDSEDFGFWVRYDSVEEAIDGGDALKVDDLNEVPKRYTGEVFEVNDHGNTTFYIARAGRLTQVWSIV